MKKTSIVAGIIVSSILGQSLALAYDAQTFQKLSPEGQQTNSIIRERISNMSEKTKLKLSYRLYKTVFNVLPALEKMSGSAFSQKIQNTIQSGKVSASQDAEVLTQNDLQDVLPETTSASNSVPAQVTQVEHRAISQQARAVVDQIGYNVDDNGVKTPLTRAQFNAKAFQYGANQSVKLNRSIANDTLDTVLNILLAIVIICAAVGLIVIFGWLGVSMVLGGLIVAAIVAIIVAFSGPYQWSR